MISYFHISIGIGILLVSISYAIIGLTGLEFYPAFIIVLLLALLSYLIFNAVKVTPVYEPPEVGSIWVHDNGILYRVKMLVNVHTQNPKKYPVMVIYENVQVPERIWCRRLDDWHRSLTFVE